VFCAVLSSCSTNFFNPSVGDLLNKASFYSWMFFVVACGVLAATALQQWAFGVAGQALSRRVRLLLFKAMLRQEIG
jgi:ATP-binding cassette subfamily B (MDR/TAP) protein 1